MIFSEYPFLRYSLFFILGVLLYPVLGIEYFSVYTGLLAILYGLYFSLVIWNKIKRRFHFRMMIPILAYTQLILSGYIFTYLKDFKNQADHLIHNNHSGKAYLGTVVGNDEIKTNSIANRLKMIGFLDEEMNFYFKKAEVICYHKLDTELKPGDVILVAGMPELIEAPNNPGEFHYQRFMQRQQIAYRHFAGSQIVRLGHHSIQPVEDFFLKIRAWVLNHVNATFPDQHARQVAHALLLGQKKNMEKELNEAYVTAGAMHVLAVSGLHVGIIYGFFFLFFKPYRMKQGLRVIYLSIIILIIWSYAMLTGMSPSVMRAATMFSLMALAQMKSRNPSIFNAIALSALILLIFDPMLIYSVGFQLSYLALTGILLIQPILVSWWMPKTKLGEYIWQISMVGLAAQLMTFPVSAYYFHVFPTYFLISNLIAIPGAFLIMSVGIPMMLFFEVPILGDALVWMTEHLIILVNYLIFSIQYFPVAKIQNIYLNPSTMIFYWILLILFLGLIVKRRKWLAYAVITVIFVFGMIRCVELFLPSEKALTFYALKEGIALDYWKRYYFDYQVQDANLSFNVFPNRLASLRQAEPLTALVKGDSLVLPLPDWPKALIFHREDLLNASDFTGASFFWINDQWVKTEFNTMKGKSHLSMKLVFK